MLIKKALTSRQEKKVSSALLLKFIICLICEEIQLRDFFFSNEFNIKKIEYAKRIPNCISQLKRPQYYIQFYIR